MFHINQWGGRGEKKKDDDDNNKNGGPVRSGPVRRGRVGIRSELSEGVELLTQEGEKTQGAGLAAQNRK